MELLITSFLAGVLTILAPCVLALLPVILGGTLGSKNKLRPLIITGSLGVSVIIFTVLLKILTEQFHISNEAWKYISGGLIITVGLTMLFPNAWNTLAFKLKLYKSEGLLHSSQQKEGIAGAILLGASLGPVFTSCSPTFFIIVGTVLPQSFGVGLINLIVYTIGLMIPLLIIGYGGQKVTKKIRWAVNPNGWFKKSLGALLIIVGIAVITGLDKKIEAEILKAGYRPDQIEQRLLGN